MMHILPNMKHVKNMISELKTKLFIETFEMCDYWNKVIVMMPTITRNLSTKSTINVILIGKYDQEGNM